MSLSPPSPLEAKFYYTGLPSALILVARTSTTPWDPPTGSEADYEPKELRPIGNHPVKEAWNDHLAPKVAALLESTEVQWTTIDALRMGIAEVHDRLDWRDAGISLWR